MACAKSLRPAWGLEKQTEIVQTGRTRDAGPGPGVRECLES